MNRCILFVPLAVALFAAPARADSGISFELFTGTAYNFRTPLTIRDKGEGDVFFTARYDTKPFKGSPYFGLRIGLWKKKRAWELELIHHKLYLSNGPPGVDRFEVTHGYNLLTVNRAWDLGTYILRAGAGLALPHPEPTIRGRSPEHDEDILDFQIAGPTAQVAVGKTLRLGEKLFAVVEGKLTASYATVSWEDGGADVPNVAFHVVAGLGYRRQR